MTRLTCLLALPLVLAALPARADAIDGDWCAPDGRSMTIQGEAMRIPSGAEIIGEYSRHSARYVGPPDDAEGGHDVRMSMRGDDDMRLQRIVDGDSRPEEQWRRCRPIS